MKMWERSKKKGKSAGLVCFRHHLAALFYIPATLDGAKTNASSKVCLVFLNPKRIKRRERDLRPRWGREATAIAAASSFAEEVIFPMSVKNSRYSCQ